MAYKVNGYRPLEIFQTNIDHHGAPMEVDVAIEEMSELIKELVKNRRGRDNIGHIAEEIAHVELMLAQLKMIFDCDYLVAKEWCLAVERIYDGLIADGALEVRR